ncbi:MAG TPA: M20 family peptidase [Persephonella sp.]|nr:M20 family peptidase [Persephonella sp.]
MNITDKIIEKAIKELKTLVSIPSYEDCTEIQEYLKDRLSYIPLKKQFIPKKVNGKRQYNLVYLPKDKPILINTHTDTVPPIDMENPFTLRKQGNRLIGRGTADTKGLIASLIVALDLFKENYPDKEIPVSLAFTVDEENHTALGSLKLLEIADNITHAIVLEPTYGKICTKQMGTYEFEINVITPSCHASEFEKFDNPVKEAFKFINDIEKNLNRAVNIINFQSGWEYYAIPKIAKVLAEIKVFENEDINNIEYKLKNLTCNHKHEIEIAPVDVESFLNLADEKITNLLSLAYEKAINQKPNFGIMPSWTDASNLYKKNIKSVIFGFSSLKDAHTEREYITTEEIEKMIKILYSFFSILIQPQP